MEQNQVNNENAATPQESPRLCSGDCMMCHKEQRVFCASQMSRNAITLLVEMNAKMDRIFAETAELRGKIDAIQSNEAELFSPTVLPKEREHEPDEEESEE